jgi:hypothetical protein
MKIKGGEFDYVFVVGLDSQNERNDVGIDEEINKISVAITRAKYGVYLFYNSLYEKSPNAKKPGIFLSYMNGINYDHTNKNFKTLGKIWDIIENNDITIKNDNIIHKHKKQIKIYMSDPDAIKGLYLEFLLASEKGLNINFDNYIYVYETENETENDDDSYMENIGKIMIKLKKGQSKQMPKINIENETLYFFSKYLLWNNAIELGKWKEQDVEQLLINFDKELNKFENEIKKIKNISIDLFVGENLQYQKLLEKSKEYNHIVGYCDFMDNDYIYEIVELSITFLKENTCHER